ncbi:hypothetical protein HMN09_00827400 [Mycena chlorophos]|uniref:Uncharacterized protein n=1 Tax=Mycena chlorophos TaxID=658473 RepID=A0A8H6W644_MYCCL|nr:hypothetical protein HMN09_00827400 [Mycena chlorophos]
MLHFSATLLAIVSAFVFVVAVILTLGAVSWVRERRCNPPTDDEQVFPTTVVCPERPRLADAKNPKGAARAHLEFSKLKLAMSELAVKEANRNSRRVSKVQPKRRVKVERAYSPSPLRSCSEEESNSTLRDLPSPAFPTYLFASESVDNNTWTEDDAIEEAITKHLEVVKATVVVVAPPTLPPKAAVVESVPFITITPAAANKRRERPSGTVGRRDKENVGAVPAVWKETLADERYWKKRASRPRYSQNERVARRQDVDPLADAVPPRHAIESDDEEDEYNPLHTIHQDPNSIDVDLVGFQPASGLIVATGDVAGTWARGAQLGEQVGVAAVNKVQVGLLFSPSWAQVPVLVSEVTTRLPLWAMRPYARAVLDAVQPNKVALLDEYASPAYISGARILPADAPLRYLSTDAVPATTAQPFAPPNLIQSTSAAFVAHQAERLQSGTIFLVPAASIPPPAPRTLAPSNIARLENSSVYWDPTIVGNAHQLLLKTIGTTTNVPSWTAPPPDKRVLGRARPETEAEFSMYM